MLCSGNLDSESIRAEKVRTLYSHIAECESQSVDGCVYLAEYSFRVFSVGLLEVDACGK